MDEGLVFDIERFSPKDGPGIRTVVFFKGCNLRCRWCHNPEGLEPQPEHRFDEAKCIGCYRCIEACPLVAHQLLDGRHAIDAKRCVRCFACSGVCYSGALTQVGRRVTVEEVMREILEDRVLYRHSGGGVTLSGGEAMLQPRFVEALLVRCKAEGISTAIETNLSVSWDAYEPILDSLDLVMADIKHLDSAAHLRWTGLDNELILENADRLGSERVPLIVRTPIIPGFNDDEALVARIAQRLSSYSSLRYYELLSYNPLRRAGERLVAGASISIEFPVPLRGRMYALAAAAARERIVVRIDGCSYQSGDGEP